MTTRNPSPRTLLEAVTHFADADFALAYFVNIRWPDGVRCPTCGSERVNFLQVQRRWQCSAVHAKRQFSAKVGTVFEDSPIQLGKWLVALWIEVNAKNSVSSYEIHRALGVTQKTAWFMQQRIRLAMQTGTFTKMRGTVEVDESFIGGKARNMHKGKRKAKGTGPAGKAVVMGLLERHGEGSKVHTHVVESNSRKAIQPIIRASVEAGSLSKRVAEMRNT
jgi:hypothetical protein